MKKACGLLSFFFLLCSCDVGAPSVSSPPETTTPQESSSVLEPTSETSSSVYLDENEHEFWLDEVDNLELTVGERRGISAFLDGEYAGDLYGGYALESSDPSIVLTEGNSIQALAVGTATVKGYMLANPALTDSFTVNVGPAEVSDPSTPYFTQTELYLLEGQSVGLLDYLDLNGHDLTDLFIYSSDDNVVRYDGLTNAILGLHAGTCSLFANVRATGEQAWLDVYVEQPRPDLEFSLLYNEKGDPYAYEVSRYLGSEDTVYLPETYLGRPVIRIGASAFEGNSNIANVYAEGDNMVEIGPRAFADCPGLQSYALFYQVKVIGEEAFAGAAFALTDSSLTIVAAETIEDRAFYGAAIKNVYIESKNIEVAKEAFFSPFIEKVCFRAPQQNCQLGEDWLYPNARAFFDYNFELSRDPSYANGFYGYVLGQGENARVVLTDTPTGLVNIPETYAHPLGLSLPIVGIERCPADYVFLPKTIEFIAEGAFDPDTIVAVETGSKLTYSESWGTEADKVYFGATSMGEENGIYYLAREENGHAYSIALKVNEVEDDLVIVDEYDGFPVEEIAPYAGSGLYLSSLTLPSSLSKIGEGAFRDTRVARPIVIPATAVNLSDGVFQYDRGDWVTIVYFEAKQMPEAALTAFTGDNFDFQTGFLGYQTVEEGQYALFEDGAGSWAELTYWHYFGPHILQESIDRDGLSYPVRRVSPNCFADFGYVFPLWIAKGLEVELPLSKGVGTYNVFFEGPATRIDGYTTVGYAGTDTPWIDDYRYALCEDDSGHKYACIISDMVIGAPILSEVTYEGLTYPVEEIAPYAFGTVGSNYDEPVSIPASIKRIDRHAFYNIRIPSISIADGIEIEPEGIHNIYTDVFGSGSASNPEESYSFGYVGGFVGLSQAEDEKAPLYPEEDFPIVYEYAGQYAVEGSLIYALCQHESGDYYFTVLDYGSTSDDIVVAEEKSVGTISAPVESVAANAFRDLPAVDVFLPSSLKTIGHGAMASDGKPLYFFADGAEAVLDLPYERVVYDYQGEVVETNGMHLAKVAAGSNNSGWAIIEWEADVVSLDLEEPIAVEGEGWSVTQIVSRAFAGNQSLEYLHMNLSQLSHCGARLFEGCSSLSLIDCSGTFNPRQDLVVFEGYHDSGWVFFSWGFNQTNDADMLPCREVFGFDGERGYDGEFYYAHLRANNSATDLEYFIIGYTGNQDHVEIPNSITTEDGRTVTVYGVLLEAFEGTTVTSISFERGIRPTYIDPPLLDIVEIVE